MSENLMYTFLAHCHIYKTFFKTCLRVNIWSIVAFLFKKPHQYLDIIFIAYFSSLCEMAFNKTL